jgi:hypothetical protein
MPLLLVEIRIAGDDIIGIKGRVGFGSCCSINYYAKRHPPLEKHTLVNGNNTERTTRKLVRNVIS